MKNDTSNKLWKVIMATMLIVLFPYMFNVLADAFRKECNIIFPGYFNLEILYTALSVGLPAALTYVVIWQSEKQQEQNDATQARMEELNKQMFDLEIKSKKGYFIPKIYLDEYKNTYLHRWEKGIALINEGDDIAFIQKTELYANGKLVRIEDSVNACFLNKGPFSEAIIETPFSNEVLSQKEIEVKIVLFMKNTKNYYYKQIIDLGFKNANGYGNLNKFDMSIEDV